MNAPPVSLHVNRALDFSRVDAVGFDLDHTLALYDDHALNLLAAEETIELLIARRGYAAGSFEAIPTDPIPPVRTMALDLRHGAVVKLDAREQVSLARRGGQWLPPSDLATLYPAPRTPAGEVHAIHSPFDVPLVWLYEHLSASSGAGENRFDLNELANDIRVLLDVAHTQGRLKKRVVEQLGRFVSPAGSARVLLEEWSRTGKALFVVTNSHRDYAETVLDAVIGSSWRSLFARVVVDANKPAFFDRGYRAVRTGTGRDGRILEGATALDLEARLGARGGRILYVGDNLRTDAAAARSFGWRTALVVPELTVSSDSSPWGRLLSHQGCPTRFSRALLEHADLVCDRVDHLDALAKDTLEPHGDFMARIGGGDRA